VNITNAVKKFIVTHAKITINLFHNGAVNKVFGFLYVSSSVGSSHSKEQNHHNGTRFNVY
jgi:hypothetical protein